MGTDNVVAWGVQLGKFSGMTIGQPVNATITITTIPGPATLALLGLAGYGLVGSTRRRS